MKKNLLLIGAFLLCVNIVFGQWQKTSGPANGYVEGIAVLDTTVFACTYSGGVFSSVDDGNSWNAVNNGLGDLYVNCIIAVDSTIFAGTLFDGVYLSTNKGSSWKQVNTGLGNTWINTFATNGTSIFAGTNGGVFVSDLKNISWTTSDTGLAFVNINSLAVNGQTVFAGAQNAEIFESTNSGRTWVTADANLVFESLIVSAICIKNDTVFAGTTTGGVYVSYNNGGSWTTSNNGLGNLQINTLLMKDSVTFAGTDGGIYVSNDYGASWAQRNAGLADSSVETIAVGNNTIYAGTLSGYVYKSGTPLGINILAAKNSSLNVYPVPSHDRITIDFNNKVSSNYHFRLLDLMGSCVLSKAGIDNNTSIDISGYAKGVYFIEVFNEKSEVIGRKKLIFE